MLVADVSAALFTTPDPCRVTLRKPEAEVIIQSKQYRNTAKAPPVRRCEEHVIRSGRRLSFGLGSVQTVLPKQDERFDWNASSKLRVLRKSARR